MTTTLPGLFQWFAPVSPGVEVPFAVAVSEGSDDGFDCGVAAKHPARESPKITTRALKGLAILRMTTPLCSKNSKSNVTCGDVEWVEFGNQLVKFGYETHEKKVSKIPLKDFTSSHPPCGGDPRGRVRETAETSVSAAVAFTRLPVVTGLFCNLQPKTVRPRK